MQEIISKMREKESFLEIAEQQRDEISKQLEIEDMDTDLK